MTPEQREFVKQRMREFRELPPEQRKALRAKWQSMTPEQKTNLMQRWQNMTPEQRENVIQRRMERQQQRARRNRN
jgi:predicted Fe-S protein YdhL (DUF1289 family)